MQKSTNPYAKTEEHNTFLQNIEQRKFKGYENRKTS